MPVLLTEDWKSMVGQALTYMQHMHIVCGELPIYHDLDLDQKLYDTDYPNPLLHEALDEKHRMVMLLIC